MTMGQARRRLNRQLHWKRKAAAQRQSETGRDDDEIHEASPFVKAIARKDEKWSDWLNNQLVKET
jgi:hypothetical protein